MKFLLASRCLLWTIERRWRPACNVISSTNDALGLVSLNAINFITLGTNLIDLHPNKCSVNLMRNSAGHGSRLDVRLVCGWSRVRSSHPAKHSFVEIWS